MEAPGAATDSCTLHKQDSHILSSLDTAKMSSNTAFLPELSNVVLTSESEILPVLSNVVFTTEAEVLPVLSNVILTSTADGLPVLSNVRLSSEAFRLELQDHNKPNRFEEMTPQDFSVASSLLQKKKGPSFQITSVVKYANVDGEESPDETEEASDMMDSSKMMSDIDQETPSFSEEYSRSEDIAVIPSVISANSSYGITAVVQQNDSGALLTSKLPQGITISVSKGSITLSENTGAPADSEGLASTNRFKIVKLDYKNPRFRRGRWVCCDFLDSVGHTALGIKNLQAVHGIPIPLALVSQGQVTNLSPIGSFCENSDKQSTQNYQTSTSNVNVTVGDANSANQLQSQNTVASSSQTNQAIAQQTVESPQYTAGCQPTLANVPCQSSVQTVQQSQSNEPGSLASAQSQLPMPTQTVVICPILPVSQQTDPQQTQFQNQHLSSQHQQTSNLLPQEPQLQSHASQIVQHAAPSLSTNSSPDVIQHQQGETASLPVQPALEITQNVSLLQPLVQQTTSPSNVPGFSTGGATTGAASSAQASALENSSDAGKQTLEAVAAKHEEITHGDESMQGMSVLAAALSPVTSQLPDSQLSLMLSLEPLSPPQPLPTGNFLFLASGPPIDASSECWHRQFVGHYKPRSHESAAVLAAVSQPLQPVCACATSDLVHSSDPVTTSESRTSVSSAVASKLVRSSGPVTAFGLLQTVASSIETQTSACASEVKANMTTDQSLSYSSGNIPSVHFHHEPKLCTSSAQNNQMNKTVTFTSSSSPVSPSSGVATISNEEMARSRFLLRRQSSQSRNAPVLEQILETSSSRVIATR